MLTQTKYRMDDTNQYLSAAEIPFAFMRKTFAKACGRQDVHRQFLLAGYSIDLRIVGARLASEVIEAFAHLEEVDTRRPALSIELWEGDAVELMEQQSWSRLPESVLIMMKASEDGRYVCEQRPEAIAILDRSAHRIVACTRSAEGRYLDERARPFHRLLSMWLNDRGIQFVHAGLVSVQGRGLLFGGQGGAGKSTTSVACLRAGFEYLGDDFIGLENAEDGTCKGYGLFASCLLELEHVKRFADLLPHALAPNHRHEDKALFYLNDLFPAAVRHQVKIDGIALPRIADRDESFFEPASKIETLLALAPTSVMLLPVPTAKAFHALAHLVERVPCYQLHIGRDIGRIPDAVRALADELGARAAH